MVKGIAWVFMRKPFKVILKLAPQYPTPVRNGSCWLTFLTRQGSIIGAGTLKL